MHERKQELRILQLEIIWNWMSLFPHSISRSSFRFNDLLSIYSSCLSPIECPNIQEKHHFMNSTVPKSLQEIQSLDQLKQKLVREKGITLIIVPCWWDKQLERFLSHSLGSSRPECFPNN